MQNQALINGAPVHMRVALYCDNAHARLHGALEMDFGISQDKLKPYAAFRAFAVLTKRACARLKC